MASAERKQGHDKTAILKKFSFQHFPPFSLQWRAPLEVYLTHSLLRWNQIVCLWACSSSITLCLRTMKLLWWVLMIFPKCFCTSSFHVVYTPGQILSSSSVHHVVYITAPLSIMLMVRNAYICAEEPISVCFVREDTCGYQAVRLPEAFPDRALSNEMAPSHRATSSLL